MPGTPRPPAARSGCRCRPSARRPCGDAFAPPRCQQGRDHGDLAHRASRVRGLADSGRVDSAVCGHEDVVGSVIDSVRRGRAVAEHGTGGTRTNSGRGRNGRGARREPDSSAVGNICIRCAREGPGGGDTGGGQPAQHPTPERELRCPALRVTLDQQAPKWVGGTITIEKRGPSHHVHLRAPIPYGILRIPPDTADGFPVPI